MLSAAAYSGQVAAQAQQPSAQPQEQVKAQAQDVQDAISGGKLLFQLRPRYEFVDQSNKPDQANAFTVRTLLGMFTGPSVSSSWMASTPKWLPAWHVPWTAGNAWPNPTAALPARP